MSTVVLPPRGKVGPGPRPGWGEASWASQGLSLLLQAFPLSKDTTAQPNLAAGG